MFRHIKPKSGFTLVEISVVIGIVLTLTGLAVVNLSGAQRRSYLASTTSTLIADMKSQQSKAMSGETEGRSTHDAYGIYFESSRYTLFHGSAYSAADPSNVVINLDNYIAFSSITFPQSMIIFASGSGELSSYTPGSNTITIRNTLNSEQKTVSLNRLGVITGVQ